MGLGKTMQTLAYLGSLMRARTISNAIVVCPKSVVGSWEREANLVLRGLCAEGASVHAVTSDMGKERRRRIFEDALCAGPGSPCLVVTTYVSSSWRCSIYILHGLAADDVRCQCAANPNACPFPYFQKRDWCRITLPT